MDWLSVLSASGGFGVIRAILGFTLVFFLPGFAWTLVFFSGKQINLLERTALSFGLSIAIVTLSILALDRLLVTSITGFNAVLIILAATIIPVVTYYLKPLSPRSGLSACLKSLVDNPST